MSAPPRKPNLFIIGAMKSGTTSLHEYLNTHPQIAMSSEKEPGYFVKELSLHKGEDWYLNLFDGDECYQYVGESSTHYTKLPIYRGVPERLHQFNPSARLIYIMRNPFDRVVSHYWHNVRDVHHGGELRPLLTAVQEDPQYLAFGDYATQLEPYINLFGNDAIFTLTFEALTEDPQREVHRIYRWLDLPPSAMGNLPGKAHNQKPKEMMGVAGAGILNRIQYSGAWDRISPLVPSWMKRWAKQLAYEFVDERQSQQDIHHLEDAIRERQERQIERLSKLLDREFPEWRAQVRRPGHTLTSPQEI